MTSVYVLNNNLDKSLGILKRKMAKEGIIRDVLERRGAMSRGEKRRAKDHNAKLKRKKSERQGSEYRQKLDRTTWGGK